MSSNKSPDLKHILLQLTLPWRGWWNLWRSWGWSYSGRWRSWEIQYWWYRSWRGRPHWRWRRPISIWYIWRWWSLFQRWLIIIKCFYELSFLFTHFWTKLRFTRFSSTNTFSTFLLNLFIIYLLLWFSKMVVISATKYFYRQKYIKNAKFCIFIYKKTPSILN